MIKTNDRKIRIVKLLIALTLAFIWGNSLLKGSDSARMSGSVMLLVQSFLNFIGIDTSGIPADTFHMAVRKLAHFSEYALLGFEFMLYYFLVRLDEVRNRRRLTQMIAEDYSFDYLLARRLAEERGEAVDGTPLGDSYGRVHDSICEAGKAEGDAVAGAASEGTGFDELCGRTPAKAAREAPGMAAIHVSFRALELHKCLKRELPIGLMVAIMDEAIQLTAAGRACSLRDVMIDFAGYACGTLLMLLAARLSCDRKQ